MRKPAEEHPKRPILGLSSTKHTCPALPTSVSNCTRSPNLYQCNGTEKYSYINLKLYHKLHCLQASVANSTSLYQYRKYYYINPNIIYYRGGKGHLIVLVVVIPSVHTYIFMMCPVLCSCTTVCYRTVEYNPNVYHTQTRPFCPVLLYHSML